MFDKQSIELLNDLGYDVVKLPRENVDPLLVISKSNGRLNILGPITDLVRKSKVEPPTILRDNIVTGITATICSNLKLAGEINFLEKLLPFLSGIGIGLKGGHKKGTTIDISFRKVLTDTVRPTKIDNYLSRVKPNLKSTYIDTIREGNAYIITDTLKSNSFKVAAHDNKGHQVGINLSLLKGVIDNNVTVAKDKENKKVLSFKWDKHLRFAYKAIGLELGSRTPGELKDLRLIPKKPEGTIGPMYYITNFTGFDDPNDPF